MRNTILILVIIISLFGYYKLIFFKDERPENYYMSLNNGLLNIDGFILYEKLNENDYDRVKTEDGELIFTENRVKNSQGLNEDEYTASYYTVDMDRLGMERNLNLRRGDNDGYIYLETYSKVLEKLDGIFEEIKASEDKELPSISLIEERDLLIETAKAEKSFDIRDLLTDFIRENEEDITYQVKATSEKDFRIDFYISAESHEQDRQIITFFTQDLEDVYVVEATDEGLIEAVKEGAFEPYQQLFQDGDEDGEYLAIDVNSKKFIDTVGKRLLEVQDDDYLSQNGQQVYHNGENQIHLDEVQRIQRIDNYLANNDSYLEFTIDFDEIARMLQVKGKEKNSYHAELVYLDLNMALIELEFSNGLKTNLLLDFIHHVRGEPDLYLVNLYMQ